MSLFIRRLKIDRTVALNASHRKRVGMDGIWGLPRTILNNAPFPLIIGHSHYWRLVTLCFFVLFWDRNEIMSNDIYKGSTMIYQCLKRYHNQL
jgi:hypothetical protein